MIKWIKNLFIRRCPNCASAWTGGHPDPQDITFCIICSNPRTGKVRGWVWRWVWLHGILVTRHNVNKVNREDI